VAKKNADGCFLCESPGKTKKFTFYSGIMKGGTTHRTIHYIVTFLERWSDLTMHEVQLCSDCKIRLWRKKQLPPMILYVIGAAVFALLGLVGVILVPGVMRFVAAALFGIVVLIFAALFFVQFKKYSNRKPKNSLLEPIVLQEVVLFYPDDNRTYLTTDQYIERHEKGAF